MTQTRHVSPPPSRRRVQQKRKPSLFIRFIGVLGELMITASLVLGLFIFWQLYWTTWEVEGEKAQAIETFHNELPPVEKPKDPPKPRTDAPPVPEPAAYGSMIGVLHIPVWDYMQVPVAEGTGQELLDLAYAGHYQESDEPGAIGNFAMAAHRRSYGNNFRHVDTIEPGTPVVMETADAFMVYEVVSKEIVLPTQWQVILPVPNEPGVAPEKRMMTMTTCSTETGGQFGNSHRYIVYLEFKHWTPRSEGLPMELQGERGK